MKARQLVAAALVTLITVPAFAADHDTSAEEGRGLLVGAILGATLAGPIGAGVGAVVGGGLFGKLIGFGRINEELEAELQVQQSSFSESSQRKVAEISHQDERISHQDEKISHLNEQLDYLIDFQSASWNNRELPIQFRTGSSKVENHYESQLREIARILSRNLDTKITLSGFADRRGATEYNQNLSEQRVAEIKLYMLSHGVKPEQIVTTAFGETKPLKKEQTPEGNFFDRRVVMQFSFDVKSHLATR